MRTLRRIAVLVVLSVSGIALLGPLAARSAVELAAPVADGLLDAAPGSDAGAAPARGLLATREMTDAAASAGTAELIGEAPVPAPGSVTFTATIVTIPTPAPAPAPAAPAAPAPAVGGGSVWDALAQCESGGNWSINTGNGYYGGLQFNYATWHDFGGGEFAEYPHQATREEQIVVAERLHAARGFQPWPACRAKLGLP